MDERDLLSGERVRTSRLRARHAYAYCMPETKWAKQNEQEVQGGKNTETHGQEMILPTNKFAAWPVPENTHLFLIHYTRAADRALSKNFSS